MLDNSQLQTLFLASLHKLAVSILARIAAFDSNLLNQRLAVSNAFSWKISHSSSMMLPNNHEESMFLNLRSNLSEYALGFLAKSFSLKFFSNVRQQIKLYTNVLNLGPNHQDLRMSQNHSL